MISGDTTASGSSASFVGVDFRHPNPLTSVSAATAVHGSMPAERWPLLCSAVSCSTSGSTSTIGAAHLEIAAARSSFDANLQRILDASSLDEIWSVSELNPVRGSLPPFYSTQRRPPARSLRGDPPGGPSMPLPIAPAPSLWGSASAHRLPTAGFLPVVPEAMAAVAGGSSPVHGLVSLPDRLHGLFASTDFPPSAELNPSAHDAASRAAAHLPPLPAASLMLPPQEPRAGTAGTSAAASAEARWESDSAATLAAPLATSTSAPLAAGFATFAGSGRHADDSASRWRRRLEQREEPVAASSGGAPPFAGGPGAAWALPSVGRLVAAQGAAGGGADVLQAAIASEWIPAAAAAEDLPQALEHAGGGMEGACGGGGMEDVVGGWGTWDTAWGVMGMEGGLSSGGTGVCMNSDMGSMDMSAGIGMGMGMGMSAAGTGMGVGMGTGMGSGMGMDIEAAVEMEMRCAEELLRRTAMVPEAEARALVPHGEAAPAMASREGEATAMVGEVEAPEDCTQGGGMADPPSHPLGVAAAQAPPASRGDAPSPGACAAPEVARFSRRNTWSAAPLPSSADAALMQAMELDRLEHDAAMARLTAMAASHGANRALPPAPPLASTVLSPTAPSTRLSAAPASAARSSDAIMTAAPAAVPAAMADSAMDAPFLPALDFPSRPKRAKPPHQQQQQGQGQGQGQGASVNHELLPESHLPPVLPAASAPSACPAAVSLAEAFRMEALRAGWGAGEGKMRNEETREGGMKERGGQGVEAWQGGARGGPAGGESVACGASSGQTGTQGGACEGDGEAVDAEVPGGSEGQADGDGGAEERGREAVMEGPGGSAAAELRNPVSAAGGGTASGGGGKSAQATAAAGAACAGHGGGVIFDPWAPTRTTTCTVAHLLGIAPAVHELLARRFAANQERSTLPAVAPEVQQLFARRHTVSGTPSLRHMGLQHSLPHPLQPLPFTLPPIQSLEDPLPLMPRSLASFSTTAPASAAAVVPSARTLFPSMLPFSSTTLGGSLMPSPPTTVPAPFPSPAIPSPATSSPAIPFRFLTPPLTPSSPPLTVTPRGAISAGAASSSSSGSAGAAGPFARSRGFRGSTGPKGSTGSKGLTDPFTFPPPSAALQSEAARGSMLHAGSKRSLSSSTLPSITLPAIPPFPPSAPIQRQTFLPLSAPPPPFAATSSLLPFLPNTSTTDPLRCLGCGIELDQESAREALALPEGVGPPLPPGSEMLAGRIPRVHGCNECLPLLVPSYFRRRAAAKKQTPNKST
ncbi:unnamed protein product [Closterium sp. NIES-53]